MDVIPSLLCLNTGSKIAVFQAGRGPDLIYLPGSNVDFRLRPGVLGSKLLDCFRVTTIEHRGLARSSGPSGPWKMQDFADDVLQIMSILKIRNADLFGESFGAMVAQWLVLRTPESFGRVTLACGSAGGQAGVSFPFHDWQDQSPEERARQVLRHINLGNQEIEKIDPIRFHEMTSARVDFEKRFLSGLVQPDGYERLLAARATHDTSGLLGQVKLPVLIMAGRQDGIAPLANQLATRKLIERSTFKDFPGGHDCLWATTEPLEWFLREWVTTPRA